jgi:hypothetical protein
MMGIIAWILLGVVVAAGATAFHRGAREPGFHRGARDPDRFVLTFALAVGGALLGGFVAAAVGIGSIGSFFHLAAWLIAVACAFLALAVCNAVVAARRGPRSA